MMWGRAFTMWGVLFFSTIALTENCYGGWKFTWTKCNAGSTAFDFNLVVSDPISGAKTPEMEMRVLSTVRDICTSKPLWWWWPRCDRQIISDLFNYMVARLFIAGLVLPVAWTVLWLFLHKFSFFNHLIRNSFTREVCLGTTSLMQVCIIFVPLMPALLP